MKETPFIPSLIVQYVWSIHIAKEAKADYSPHSKNKYVLDIPKIYSQFE